MSTVQKACIFTPPLLTPRWEVASRNKLPRSSDITEIHSFAYSHLSGSSELLALM